MTGNYWLIIITFLCITPFAKMQGIKFSTNGQKIRYFQYNWFKKKVVAETVLPNDIKNILLQCLSAPVRSYSSVKAGFRLQYKSRQEFKTFFFLTNKTAIEIKHPKVYHYSQAYRIARYIAKKLNLTVYEKVKGDYSLIYHDNEYYNKTGREAAFGFQALGKDENEK
jgi:hypothetical protein